MASVGVPGALLPLVIAMEVLGALAIILGWHTRAVSVLLAGFTLLAGVLFHSQFADQIQMIMFLKNVSIAGGFLVWRPTATGAGAWTHGAPGDDTRGGSRRAAPRARSAHRPQPSPRHGRTVPG
jgi:uncharacterized membrane protein YphA (DoxX/SURF4 family)